MRVRGLLAMLGAAALSVALTASPASAGTGSSTQCSDGVGREVPIATAPVTLGLETSTPGSSVQRIVVCYSGSAVGQPGTVTGGSVTVEFPLVTSATHPGFDVTVTCTPDIATGVAPACALPNGFSLAPGDAAASVPPSGICLVSIGSGCAAYAPGLKVTLGGSPYPTFAVDVLGVPLSADVAPQCVAVVVTCP